MYKNLLRLLILFLCGLVSTLVWSIIRDTVFEYYYPLLAFDKAHMLLQDVYNNYCFAVVFFVAFVYAFRWTKTISRIIQYLFQSWNQGLWILVCGLSVGIGTIYANFSQRPWFETGLQKTVQLDFLPLVIPTIIALLFNWLAAVCHGMKVRRTA